MPKQPLVSRLCKLLQPPKSRLDKPLQPFKSRLRNLCRLLSEVVLGPGSWLRSGTCVEGASNYLVCDSQIPMQLHSKWGQFLLVPPSGKLANISISLT